MVQHGGILNARLRHLRQRRPEHSGGPGVPQRQSRTAEARSAARPHEPAAPRGSIQSAEQNELRSAGQFLRVADVRTGSLGRGATPYPVRGQIHLLGNRDLGLGIRPSLVLLLAALAAACGSKGSPATPSPQSSSSLSARMDDVLWTALRATGGGATGTKTITDGTFSITR